MEISLDKLAKVVDGKVIGDKSKIIRGAAPFDDATKDDITFIASAKLLKKINETDAGAVIVSRDFGQDVNNIVCVANPQLAFAMVLHLFHPPLRPAYFEKPSGISLNAHTGNNFVCGKDVLIAPFVVTGDNVRLGDQVILHPNVVLGDNVSIGNNVEIYPNVTILDNCIVGSRVIIHAGTVIGSDGFGFAFDGDKYYKILQTGIVQIDDDVEIGAGNTIDRAAFGKTRICKGVKTDNLVHIAHNVTVGENTVLVAQVGIAGSTSIGKHVALGGQVGVAGHISIGDNVRVGGQSGIAKSIPEGATVSGTPAMEHRLWLKVHGIKKQLPDLKNKLFEMEKRLNKIEKKKE